MYSDSHTKLALPRRLQIYGFPAGTSSGISKRIFRTQGRKRRSVAHTSSIAPTPQSCCWLFTLPPELRNLIYEFALVEKEASIFVTEALWEPGLLESYVQIRLEALPIHMSGNDF